MTKIVPISITIEFGKMQREVITIDLETNQFGVNMKKVLDQMQKKLGTGAIKYLDDEYREHEGKGLKILGTEKRQVTTVAGSLTYRRRTYRSPEGGRFAPVDQILGFEPYNHRDKHLQELNCALAGRSNYRETAAISTLITQNYISPSTISRDVQRIGHQLSESDKNFYSETEGTISSAVLYGESDGIFVRLQKDKDGKKSAEIRAAITYTGKKWISGNRMRLLNKMTLTAMDINSLQWQEMIRNHMFSKYDLSHVKLMAVGGDGGSWVGSSFDLCGVNRIERVLDPFHVKRAVRSAFSDVLDLNSFYEKLFSEGFDAVSLTLKPLLNKGKPSVRKARHECFRYLQNHSDELLPLICRSLPFDNLCSMGCMESNIGKAIALRMKTRGCSWSRLGAESMSSILCHLPDLDNHSFNYLDFKNRSFSHSSSHGRLKPAGQPRIQQASFPIVSSGKVSEPFYKLFKGIISPQELP